jgi:ankyrin repeat protein
MGGVMNRAVIIPLVLALLALSATQRSALAVQQADEVALLQAASEGHLNTVRDLLDRGVDPDVRGEGGMTALMLAALQGHADVLNAFVVYFESAKNKAYQAAMKSDLRVLVLAQESYFADNFTYASLEALGDMFRPSTGTMIEIIAVSGTGWSATARHENSMHVCHIFIGYAEPPIEGMQEGEPVCQ